MAGLAMDVYSRETHPTMTRECSRMCPRKSEAAPFMIDRSFHGMPDTVPGPFIPWDFIEFFKNGETVSVPFLINLGS